LGQHLVAVNDSIREEVERFVGPCPLTVIPNGCRVDPPEQLQEGRAGLAFAFIGRLDKDKGFGTVLKAFTELAKMFSDVSLFVVGDGPMRQAAEAVATSNPKVKLSDGWVARSEVHRWLAGVDAVVLPSKSEGAPIAALEALTLGLPVIISEAANKSNLIKDSINGYVLPGDGADASALLETLLECVAHPEILYAMRHNASQVAMARNTIAREQYVALVNSLTPVSRRPRSNYAAKT
jgi:glycosyltransferase involved in cell wall biosynthesis